MNISDKVIEDPDFNVGWELDEESMGGGFDESEGGIGDGRPKDKDGSIGLLAKCYPNKNAKHSNRRDFTDL